MLSAIMLSHDAAAQQSTYAVGMRYHTDHSSFEDLPFDDGDLSYGIAYEYAEATAYWQLALDVTPELNLRDDIDYVLTPKINLILVDEIWRAGLGALASYLETDADDNGWTSIYWQFLAGVSLGFDRFAVDVFAFYPFKRWGNLDEFSTRDIEYGAWVRFSL